MAAEAPGGAWVLRCGRGAYVRRTMRHEQQWAVDSNERQKSVDDPEGVGVCYRASCWKLALLWWRARCVSAKSRAPYRAGAVTLLGANHDLMQIAEKRVAACGIARLASWEKGQIYKECSGGGASRTRTRRGQINLPGRACKIGVKAQQVLADSHLRPWLQAGSPVNRRPGGNRWLWRCTSKTPRRLKLISAAWVVTESPREPTQERGVLLRRTKAVRDAQGSSNPASADEEQGCGRRRESMDVSSEQVYTRR